MISNEADSKTYVMQTNHNHAQEIAKVAPALGSNTAERHDTATRPVKPMSAAFLVSHFRRSPRRPYARAQKARHRSGQPRDESGHAKAAIPRGQERCLPARVCEVPWAQGLLAPVDAAHRRYVRCFFCVTKEKQSLRKNKGKPKKNKRKNKGNKIEKALARFSVERALYQRTVLSSH